MSYRELIERLRADYPLYKFVSGRKFMFRPPRTIIFIQADQGNEAALKLQILHEVGHARLEHKFYATDVERLKMEGAAWEEARKICEQYGVEYDAEFAESELDSYRDWLHQRSKCQRCGLTRYQTQDGVYHCPECELVETKR